MSIIGYLDASGKFHTVGGLTPLPTTPACAPAATQIITVTGTTARSTPSFGSTTVSVELTPTVDMYVKFGDTSVVATTSDVRLNAGIVYTYKIGTNVRVAAIRDSSSGSLYVTELTL